MDLLTASEEEIDRRTSLLRFNIRLLAKRLAGATTWTLRQPELRGLSVGYFGASTGAAAALVAAAQLSGKVAAVVSRGGRPDLAGDALGSVVAPTLLIVGGNDGPVIDLNEQALAELGCSEKKLFVIPGATHLFEEPGTLEEVAKVAAEWFSRHFAFEEPCSNRVNRFCLMRRIYGFQTITFPIRSARESSGRRFRAYRCCAHHARSKVQMRADPEEVGKAARLQ